LHTDTLTLQLDEPDLTTGLDKASHKLTPYTPAITAANLNGDDKPLLYDHMHRSDGNLSQYKVTASSNDDVTHQLVSLLP